MMAVIQQNREGWALIHLCCIVSFSYWGMLPNKEGRESIKGHIHIKSNLM